ncbi:MAG TPA: SpoIIE family protein phosphatase [Acidobacteriaceae bacterium]|jgi:anti-sigma regulatory factor (Ser/Thr protein kinase)|nr:SpoIIE family protein phosphatase [Acidobacteriaceae bacterium]
MEIAFTEWVPVTDLSSVGEARRTALMAAQRLGFDETRSGELALLATESSRNVLLHGGGGQIVFAGMREGAHPVARILAMDKGPGIANLARAMTDGYSTAGTMGGGMGAMQRMATTLEVFTGRTGTIVLLELGKAVEHEKLRIAGMALPFPGERFCGDAWTFHYGEERTVVLLVDGLGHGWEAAGAAQEAVETFRKHPDLAPGEMLRVIHDALKKTRGAVASIAEIRPQEGTLTYAGVGNISAVVLSGNGSRSLVSHNGTLGMATSRIQEFRAEWPADAVLVLHSDGVHSRWDLSSYAGLMVRHPAVIGGALLRDFRRQRDDASVVVVKAA